MLLFLGRAARADQRRWSSFRPDRCGSVTARPIADAAEWAYQSVWSETHKFAAHIASATQRSSKRHGGEGEFVERHAARDAAKEGRGVKDG